MEKIRVLFIALLVGWSVCVYGEKKADHALFVKASPGVITSKVYYNSQDYESFRGGMGIETGYRCVLKKGYGFGLTYAHNKTEYKYGEKLDLNYIGPSFIYGSKIRERLQGSGEVGIGHANYKLNNEKQNGVGIKASADIEYLLSSWLGVNAEMGWLMTIFSEKYHGYKIDEPINGFYRVSVNVGIRLHL